ncbi:tRNA/rRNA methyltransferase, SpoU [Penicillium griseofulvum]|uniref:rRNA methyltransferase 1, mitochondrial n=1 Tax=Penicillium patulum TaxID=5078 RepID=A0A135LVU4_PENPA|nr:tRNA/rRNA methyltransferase, SpoU [Penicillium griseofulvum]KXG53076.1 tRNA/rRNA methyltransferase, SpoU [Penicillium griseofulvum]
MLSTISRTGLNGLSRVISSSRSTVLTIRHASLNSAIGEGIRRSQSADADREDRRGNESRFPKRERQYEGQYGARQYGRSGESKFNDRQTNGSRQYGQQKYERSGQSNFNEPRPYGAQQYGEKPERSGLNTHRNYGQGDRGYGAKKTWTSDGFGRKDYDRRQSPWDDNSRSPRQNRKEERFEFDEDEFIRSGDFRGLPREHQSRFQSRVQSRTPDGSFTQAGRGRPSMNEPREKEPARPRAHRVTNSMPERVKDNVKVPDTIPYTTPASEFIYGTSAVEAALRCSRRQLYKLYIYQSTDEELSAAKMTIRKLALSKNITVKMAFAGWDRLMDKMSAGRPHNGCILEASPLPKLPVRGLQVVPSISEEYFRTELAPQTREEAAVNGTDDRIRIHHPSPSPEETEQRHRYPIVLLLDGVVDTGNMGAIIRSSYFLGVDAIVLAGRNSAPLSPLTIKCSAGAAENMPILHVKNEVDFIQRSQQNGWRFYAADAPIPGSVHLDHISADGDQSAKLPITTAPSVIMMGSEATGLSSHIKSHADAIISIPGARHNSILGVESDPARIDSLNVSVAAALLMEKFLRTPITLGEVVKKEKNMEKNMGKEKMW